MGSPYLVHTQVNRIHVIRSLKGLERVLKTIENSMDNNVTERSPEWVVLRDIYSSYHKAWLYNQRVMVFLEARYEWKGWEKFQRVLIIDFSGSSDFLSFGLNDGIINHYELFNT